MPSYARLPVVAIIGGGFTGAAIALHLALRSRAGREARIVVFEPREKLGKGLAYDTDEPANRINVPASKMSLFPDDPESFARWIAETDALAGDETAFAADGQPFPRRHVFGDYVHAMLTPDLSSGAIEHRRTRVTGLARANGRWRVSAADGPSLEADFVVLAASHPETAPPRVLSPLAGNPHYITDPTAPGALDGIGRNDRVLIIGNGLTSADVVAALSERGHVGHIVSVSRRGLRSRGHPPVASEPFGDFLTAPAATASQLLFRIRRTLREARRVGLGWHPVLDAVRAQGQQIWQALPVPERRRLARHTRPYWDAHRFRIAPQVERVLDDAIRAARLEVLAGSLASASVAGAALDVTVKLRERGEYRELTVDTVVVTTGPAHGGILKSQPFLTELETRGVLALCPTGLGLLCDRRSRALDADGKVVPGLFIGGPLARGTFGELMGLPQVTDHAVFVADQLGTALETLAADRRKERGPAG
ncbi:FAD/NAD(P)-binding protein [Ciceribacter ferrooxidans]|uniref:Hydroxyacylglutathione hydrolase n=1 Tax=Ciceribacter ferrooxidans TaxID=2509717 RepID=A0A4Q2T2S3_9HYPH|nr:FAD/NAD(P)-binding protein [Ciceribacter ferrooxidans]RYC10989.1 hydroxyacylglutathione hydrolase [Ciceribacter ferrooxidans]